LLTTLYEAVAVEPRLGADTTGALGPPVSVQVMAERLLRSPIFAGLVERTLVGNFKQVTQFLSDKAIKKDVLDLVDEEIDSSTRVLIGHSLGSVIAYEYLCQYKPPGIELFVTLGSPLGIPNVIFNKLTPRPVPVGGAKPGAVKRWVNKVFFNRQSPTPDPFAGVWPAAVKRWVNVAEPGDGVALRKQLAGLFPPPTGVDPVADKLVYNGKDQEHAICPYLNAAVTGAALATAL
jgi:pimeloyl-ACP methyl ester carboxylesterase